MTRQKNIDELFNRCRTRAVPPVSSARAGQTRRRTCPSLGACEKKPSSSYIVLPGPTGERFDAIRSSSSLSREEEALSRTKTVALAACAWVPIWWKRIHDSPCPVAHPFIFLRGAHASVVEFVRKSWGEDYEALAYEGSSVPVCGVHLGGSFGRRVDRALPGSRVLRRHGLTVIFLEGTERAEDFLPPGWRFAEINLSGEAEEVEHLLRSGEVRLGSVLARARSRQEERLASSEADTLFQVAIADCAKVRPEEVLSCHGTCLRACAVGDPDHPNAHDWV